MSEDMNFEKLGANLPEDDEDFRKIVLIGDDGITRDYTVLFTFDSEDYNKSYVVVYPTSDEEKDEINVEAYSYILDSEGNGTFGDLRPIEDEKELDMVEEVLNTFMDDANLNQGN